MMTFLILNNMGNKKSHHLDQGKNSVIVKSTRHNEIEIKEFQFDQIPMLIKMLPKVIVEYIFLNFKRDTILKLCLVCKCFRSLIINSSKLAVLLPFGDLFIGGNFTEDEVINRLQSSTYKYLRRFTCGMLMKDYFTEYLPKEKLSQLELRNCSISDGIMDEIVKFRNLECLTLAGCRSITNKGFARLKELPFLDYLSLSGNSHLDDEGAIPIVTGCLSLKVLNLKKTSVTDKTLFELANNNKIIQELYLDEFKAKLITNASIIQILEKCVKLEVIHLDYLEGVDKEIIPSLQTYKLKYLREIQAKTPMITYNIKNKWDGKLDIASLLEFCPKIYYVTYIP
eukprot:TRINITY_DN8510_c0_g1_i1.p2 TRINITY_DN8510_c0_g1~~TRINITY_DN8510_c0_g1_i1.p2  ORF type:complete len:340 (-),score=57.78 TRINITY_DN8510_c0_g1_i1:24-1043(-)